MCKFRDLPSLMNRMAQKVFLKAAHCNKYDDHIFKVQGVIMEMLIVIRPIILTTTDDDNNNEDHYGYEDKQSIVNMTTVMMMHEDA